MKIKWDYLGWKSNKIDGYGQEDHNYTLHTEINKASSNLFKKGCEKGANAIYINEEVFELIKTLEYFHLKSSDSISDHVGSLSGRYLVYIKKYISDYDIIVLNESEPVYHEIIHISNFGVDISVDETILPIIFNQPQNLLSIKETDRLLNPVTYKLLNLSSWEDGLYVYPSLFEKDKIDLIVEVKDKKVIKAYKNLK